MTKLQMNPATLEHANITVKNPQKTAELLCNLFGWHIRWSGTALDNGHTVHVGNQHDGNTYLALYTPPQLKENRQNHRQLHNLNHLGILVDDLECTEKRVTEQGFNTFSHADYHPGRRFYFNLEDGFEIEVISYNQN